MEVGETCTGLARVRFSLSVAFALYKAKASSTEAGAGIRRRQDVRRLGAVAPDLPSTLSRPFFCSLSSTSFHTWCPVAGARRRRCAGRGDGGLPACRGQGGRLISPIGR